MRPASVIRQGHILNKIQDDFNFLAYKLGERLTDAEIEDGVLTKNIDTHLKLEYDKKPF